MRQGNKNEKIEQRKAVEMTGLDKKGVDKERDDQEKRKVDRIVIEEDVNNVKMNLARIGCLEGNRGVDLAGSYRMEYMQVDEMQITTLVVGDKETVNTTGDKMGG